MPSAEKRRRQKENTARAREERNRADRQRRQRRNTVRVVIAAVVAVGLFLLITAVFGGSDKKTASPTNSSTTSSTTVPPTTAPIAAPPSKSLLDPNKGYYASIDTSCGTILVSLDVKTAPKGANNFVYLAKQHYFDPYPWNRAVTNFVIQTGSQSATNSGGVNYAISTETPTDGFRLGDLGWAKGDSQPAGTAGSQWFVVTGDPSTLNQKANGSIQYGRFGHVVAGLGVAQAIESFAPASGDGPLTQPVYITKVTVYPVPLDQVSPPTTAPQKVDPKTECTHTLPPTTAAGATPTSKP